jgi:hypothetical protein
MMGFLRIQKEARRRMSKQRRNKMKTPWEMNQAEFEKYVVGGKLHQGAGIVLPGENEARSWLRYGLINGYPERDIAYFYALRGHGHGYQEYIADCIHEGRNVPAQIVYDLFYDLYRSWEEYEAECIRERRGLPDQIFYEWDGDKVVFDWDKTRSAHARLRTRRSEKP